MAVSRSGSLFPRVQQSEAHARRARHVALTLYADWNNKLEILAGFAGKQYPEPL